MGRISLPLGVPNYILVNFILVLGVLGGGHFLAFLIGSSDERITAGGQASLKL